MPCKRCGSTSAENPNDHLCDPCRQDLMKIEETQQ